MLVQQCNVGLIEVVLSLSLGDVGYFDGLAVCEDDAFAGFEGLARGNLDGFYGCDMIGLVHFCIPKPSSSSWAVSLFICRASHPGESSLSENKNGRLAWKVHVGRPFGVRGKMRLLNWLYVASYLGFICGLDTDTPCKLRECVGLNVGLVRETPL